MMNGVVGIKGIKIPIIPKNRESDAHALRMNFMIEFF